MRPRFWPRVVLSMQVAAAGCGDGDGGNGPGPHGLSGTWEANEVEFVNLANPTQKADLVALGGSLTVALNVNQTCRMVITFPGEPAETIDGTWSSSSEVLTIQYSGPGYTVTYQWDWSLSGNTLILSGAHGEFDFDGDDVDEDAILNLVLSRQ